MSVRFRWFSTVLIFDRESQPVHVYVRQHMISFRIHIVFHLRKRMCHFTGCPVPLLHVSMQRLDTFGPGGLGYVHYVMAGLGPVGD